MEESKGHRKHDRQFKEEAVKLVTEGNRAVAEVVARGLGIHANSSQKKGLESRALRQNLLRTWKKKYKEDPTGSFPGKGHLKSQDEEFKRLQRENANLKEDREILKKALAIFSKHPK